MLIPADDPRLTPVETRKDLLARGYDDRMLAKAVRDGALQRPRRGAYVAGDAWARLDEEGRYAVRARACFAQARTAVVLTHTSALPFLGAPTWGLGLADIHLTRDDGRTGRHEAGVRQHCGRLDAAEVIVRYGLRFSSPLRACMEVIAEGTVESALAVVNHFLHSGEATMDRLRARYADGIARWPHTLGGDLVLRLADGRLESVGETRTCYFLWRHGFPPAQPQFGVVKRDGRVFARLDFAWPELGIWLEFDGKVKYEKHLRDGESVTDAVLREKRREQTISELTGWRCFRITWADLEEPEKLARRLREFIASVAASRRAGRAGR